MQTDYQYSFRIALATIKAPWFFEIGEALTDALLDMGYNAVLEVDTVENLTKRWTAPSNSTWIVLTPEIYHHLPANAIAYNLEQLDARASHVPPAALHHLADTCRKARCVWDFSMRNMQFWAAHDIPAVHVPIGYTPRMTYPVSMSAEGSRLVFIGTVYGRRQMLIDEVKQAVGADRFDLITDAYCYGDARLGQAHASSKITALASACLAVNIKPVAPELTCTETSRLWWCIANRVFVISEADGDEEGMRPFKEAGIPFVNADRLAPLTAELMAEAPDRLVDRATAALNYLRSNYRYTKALEGKCTM
jgi:hypothetical protein